MEDERKTRKQLIAELQVLRLEQSEQIRITSEKFTKAFLQNSIPMTITTVKEGRFVDVSNAFLQLTGLKRDEVIGHTSRETGFITEEQRTFFYNELSKNGRVENLEMEVRPKGRGLRYGLFNTVMMSFNNESYLLTAIQDITERKQTEKALKLSNERLVEAQKIAMIGDWEANLLTDELHWSQAIFDIFALDSKSFKPSVTAFYDAVHSDDRCLVRESEARSEQTGLHDVVHRIVRPSGEIRFVHELARRYKDNQGKLIMLRGTVQDVTERKQAEAEQAKLEAQNRHLQKSESLGRMAGAIAHHFNNQLAVVVGNLEMAMDELPRDAGPINGLNAAMQAAGKAAQMSGMMLTFLGQSPDKSEPLDIAEVCLRSQPFIRTVMPANIVTENNVPSPGPVIKGNANQIEQVLANLLTNAREAIGDNKGTISLNVRTVFPAEIPTVHRFPVDWQPQVNAYACLEVMDTGCGIKDKNIEKLFDPFFSTKFTGRGMGLPVVLGIIKAHGGVINVESERDRGSTFQIFFPVSGEKVLRQPEKVAKVLKFEEGGTVLLVEDEETLRNVAKDMLNRLGFAVLVAKDGVAALELFRQHQDEIKFVLSDLTMPRMNGWETLKALRKIQPGITVIIASGYDIAQVMSGDHPELPQAFLGKPYGLKGLRDAISQAMGKRPKTEG